MSLEWSSKDSMIDRNELHSNICDEHLENLWELSSMLSSLDRVPSYLPTLVTSWLVLNGTVISLQFNPTSNINRRAFFRSLSTRKWLVLKCCKTRVTDAVDGIHVLPACCALWVGFHTGCFKKILKISILRACRDSLCLYHCTYVRVGTYLL